MKEIPARFNEVVLITTDWSLGGVPRVPLSVYYQTNVHCLWGMEDSLHMLVDITVFFFCFQQKCEWWPTVWVETEWTLSFTRWPRYNLFHPLPPPRPPHPHHHHHHHHHYHHHHHHHHLKQQKHFLLLPSSSSSSSFFFFFFFFFSFIKLKILNYRYRSSNWQNIVNIARNSGVVQWQRASNILGWK